MSLSIVLDAYQTQETFSDKDCVSSEYWYFYNERTGQYKRRGCDNINFLVDIFGEHITENDNHSWCHVANYCSTRVTPYMLASDYDRIKEKINFYQLLQSEKANKCLRMGRYVVWPNLSAVFLGWRIYLQLAFGVKLSNLIPMKFHQDLGDYNLLCDESVNFDCLCVIKHQDRLLFTNGHVVETDVKVMKLVYNNEVCYVTFAGQFVGTKNKVLINYILNETQITECSFVDSFKDYGKIDLQCLRTVTMADRTECMDVEELSDIERETIKVSPSSVWFNEFDVKITECLKIINDEMDEAMPNHGCGPNFLEDYLTLSNFVTFTYLIVNVWKFCEENIMLHDQQKVEDYLLFLHLLCSKVSNDYEHLYEYNRIYLTSEENAKSFFNSLNFFKQPQKALGYYFAIHFAVFKKFNTWKISSNFVRECELDSDVISFGFFKKIKHNSDNYIFNGKIYEYYKNKKEHDLAMGFRSADEVQVSDLRFNYIRDFYMTEHGNFDSRKKNYKEPCPFVVLSALKKCYIDIEQKFIGQKMFNTLMGAMKNDVVLFKAYHAKKFEKAFNNVQSNLFDCRLLKLHEKTIMLSDKLKCMVDWLLSVDVGMTILLLIKKNAQDLLHNFFNKDDEEIHLMGLRVALTLQFLIPKSEITIFMWSLVKCQTIYDILSNDLTDNELKELHFYENRNNVIDCVYFNLKRFNYCEPLNDDILKEWIISGSERAINKHKHAKQVNRVNVIYNKLKKIPITYAIWTDRMIEYNHTTDDLYSFMVRFYIRIYLAKYITDDMDIKLLHNVVKGFCYFRVLTNFNATNSKAIINFCASLAIPTDYEKMALTITSKPHCGKSSLYELLDKIILVHKCDKNVYDIHNEDKTTKIKKYESQLYIMNEAAITTKKYLKTIADSTKFDSANRKYGPEESFNANYKVMITNNEMLFVKDGYDRGCSNRLGLIYMDHEFCNDEIFDGSVYENYDKKKYPEIKDVTIILVVPVQHFLANVLFYNSDPKSGYVFYKNILKNDLCYKHNKKCLYIYNSCFEAMLYVLNINECKDEDQKFSEKHFIDVLNKCIPFVKTIVHYKLQEKVDEHRLCSEFRRKYNKPKFYNADTKMYHNLSIVSGEVGFRTNRPQLKSNICDNF
uniref:ORF70 protein n=1 Tax=Plutella xylostella granulovirus TaxID=98383 RepID=A0A7U3MX48_9BBAC|nr:ORF70 protein [Plutella xylostella granulovirus]